MFRLITCHTSRNEQTHLNFCLYDRSIWKHWFGTAQNNISKRHRDIIPRRTQETIEVVSNLLTRSVIRSDVCLAQKGHTVRIFFSQRHHQRKFSWDVHRSKNTCLQQSEYLKRESSMVPFVWGPCLYVHSAKWTPPRFLNWKFLSPQQFSPSPVFPSKYTTIFRIFTLCFLKFLFYCLVKPLFPWISSPGYEQKSLNRDINVEVLICQ